MVRQDWSCSSEAGPLSSDGDVPNADLNLNPDNRQVKFDRDDALNQNSKSGFRLEVRAGANLQWRNRLAGPRRAHASEPADGHALEFLHAIAPGEKVMFWQEFFLVGQPNEELNGLDGSHQFERIRFFQGLARVVHLGSLINRREDGGLQFFADAVAPGFWPLLDHRGRSAIEPITFEYEWSLRK